MIASRQSGFPIRKSPDQRLQGTSPKHIVATLRPSSPHSSLGIHRAPLHFLLGNVYTPLYIVRFLGLL